MTSDLRLHGVHVTSCNEKEHTYQLQWAFCAYFEATWLLYIEVNCSSTLIARFVGPTWGLPGADRTQVGPMWATWILLSGYPSICPVVSISILAPCQECCEHQYDSLWLQGLTLQWRNNERNGVSNHWHLDCLLNCLLMGRYKKHQSSVSLACARVIHRWPVNSPYKGPVTRKRFSFDDVIMSVLTHRTKRMHFICTVWLANRLYQVYSTGRYYHTGLAWYGFLSCPSLELQVPNLVWLTPKHREMHGCVVSTAATNALVLKHQAISIHNAD